MVVSSGAAGMRRAARRGVIRSRPDLLQPLPDEQVENSPSVPSPHGRICVNHGLVVDGPLQGTTYPVPDAEKSGLFRPRVCVLDAGGKECHYRLELHTNSCGTPYYLWRFAGLAVPVIPASRRRGLRSESAGRAHTTQPFTAEVVSFSEKPAPVRVVCTSATACRKDYVIEDDEPFAEAAIRDWVSQHFRLTGHRMYERLPAVRITVLSN